MNREFQTEDQSRKQSVLTMKQSQHSSFGLYPESEVSDLLSWFPMSSPGCQSLLPIPLLPLSFLLISPPCLYPTLLNLVRQVLLCVAQDGLKQSSLLPLSLTSDCRLLASLLAFPLRSLLCRLCFDLISHSSWSRHREKYLWGLLFNSQSVLF